MFSFNLVMVLVIHLVIFTRPPSQLSDPADGDDLGGILVHHHIIEVAPQPRNLAHNWKVIIGGAHTTVSGTVVGTTPPDSWNIVVRSSSWEIGTPLAHDACIILLSNLCALPGTSSCGWATPTVCSNPSNVWSDLRMYILSEACPPWLMPS